MKTTTIVFITFICISISFASKNYKSTLKESYLFNQNIYVSELGNDTNTGTINQPFKTIKHAMSVLRPGDTLFLREGTYSADHVDWSNKGGKFTIKNYKNEHVVIDGSVAVEDLSNSDWELHKDNIYKIQLNDSISQVFVDKEWMVLARWPNARFDDETIWDRSTSWSKGNPKLSSSGIQYDNPSDDHDLANSGISMKDAVAVLYTWGTSEHIVTRHEIGDDNFSYSNPPSNYRDSRHNAYFFEGKLDLLDNETEWYFDPTDRMLYLWAPGGGKPKPGSVRCRTKIGTQRHAGKSSVFKFYRCKHITIKGIHFFATNIVAEQCNNILIEDCSFKYTVYNRHTLGKLRWGNYDDFYFFNNKNLEIINCVITRTGGTAINIRKGGGRIENCEISYIGNNLSNLKGTLTAWNAGGFIYRRNTIHTSGPPQGIIPSNNAIMELNDLSNMSLLEHDAAYFAMSQNHRNVKIRNNWVHDTKRTSLRFDGPKHYLPPAPKQRTGTVHNNVTFNQHHKSLSYMIKGDERIVFNNMCEGAIQLADYSNNPTESGIHANSVAANNVTPVINANNSQNGLNQASGRHYTNWESNRLNRNMKEQVYDWENRDFRPRRESDLYDKGTILEGYTTTYKGKAPDIGPYELDDENYWIPGRQLATASAPIPKDKGITNYKIVDLMWLKAYKSSESDIYFGESRSSVESATKNSVEYKGTQSNNIFNPGKLEKDKTYYWRIDAIVGDNVVKGYTWEFTAGISTINNITDPSDLISLYPNPASSYINLDVRVNDVSLDVYSILGQKFLSKKIHTTNETIDISKFSTGIYLFKFHREGEIIKTRKIIINNFPKS
ncbi:T9SS type A sorting domain-containing protein [Tenacibaculum amylolyticum]|uniref:T9SS type A sorting domain-containing protein n=1 Tax=Tenacibaculum amylolyticum TaxID=104269 RepID=UPI0038945B0C